MRKVNKAIKNSKGPKTITNREQIHYDIKENKSRARNKIGCKFLGF